MSGNHAARVGISLSDHPTLATFAPDARSECRLGAVADFLLETLNATWWRCFRPEGLPGPRRGCGHRRVPAERQHRRRGAGTVPLNIRAVGREGRHLLPRLRTPTLPGLPDSVRCRLKEEAAANPALVTDATPFIDSGRARASLHLGYESKSPFPLNVLAEGPSDSGNEPYQHFQVEKMRFGKPTVEQSQAGLTNDRSTIVYNDHITLLGVPEEAYRYMLGSRSAIEWIMERYQIKVDKASKIRNDPNDWSREVGNPRYIIDLLARIVTVSLETMAIVDALPALEILPMEIT
jgi:Type ISP C-terminal specificity domain